jgi:hypothetical protein
MSSSTEHLHPVEVLLVLFLFSLEAVVALAVAVLALVLVVTQRDSQQQVPGPSIHPLHTLADDLHSLPSRELMLLAGTRSRLAKHRLVDLVLAF